jgi:hypothetical protein
MGMTFNLRDLSFALSLNQGYQCSNTNVEDLYEVEWYMATPLTWQAATAPVECPSSPV